MARDPVMTDQIRPEQAVIPSRDRLLERFGWAQVRQLFDSMPIRIAVRDRDHRYLFTNLAYAKIHHLPENTMLGRTMAEILGERLDKESYARILSQSERALAGEIVQWEGWIELRGGRRYVQWTFAPLGGADGAVEAYAIITRDATDLRHTEHDLAEQSAARIAGEAELERQRDALLQSEKMAAFGSLLAGVAHELNNPLSIVIGNALLLAEELEGSAQAERAQRVQTAAERCGRIVRSFLAMARQHKAEMRPVTMQTLADGALQLLAYSMRTSGVTVEQDIASDLPPVLCDPDQMIQVLTNLLTNARHVLEERPQPRRVRLTAHADGGWVQLEVADNGPGISDDIRSRVFDPFFTTKPVGSGTGIGLAVSRGLVETHGGSLVLAPSEGEGACFVIRLPLACDASQVSGASDAAGVLQRPHTRTALVVDDEPEIGELLGEMLRKLGYRFEAKVSGEAAQAALIQRDYDVVLCDLRLPGLDGPALYDWMAEHRPHLCGCTAFITADTMSAASGRFLARAGRPILEKPFVPAELRKLLAQILPDAT
jgi:PAS domain S-box-containing protein